MRYHLPENFHLLKEIIIPKGVRTIERSDFKDCTFLNEATLPDSIKRIAGSAFENCSNLTKINIPRGVEFIEDSAFSRCKKLTILTLPNGIKTIASNAFKNCSSLKTVTTLNSIERIGEMAFYGCEKLTQFDFKPGLKSIGQDAFSNCTSLASVQIPEGVEYIGKRAFAGCKALKEISIPSTLESVSLDAFSECEGIRSFTIPISCPFVLDFLNTDRLYDNIVFTITYNSEEEKDEFYLENPDIIKELKKNNRILFLNNGLIEKDNTTRQDSILSRDSIESTDTLTSYEVPEGIEIIKENTFSGFTNLQTIKLPSTLKRILFNAFKGCTSLKSITIPEGVEYIGRNAFENCISLEGISLPSTLKHLGALAFYGCSSLSSITIPNKIKNIEDGTFYNCQSLQRIMFSPSIERIGQYAFAGCNSLEEVTIPEGVRIIENAAFSACTKLKTITLPHSLKSFDSEGIIECQTLERIIIPIDSPVLLDILRNEHIEKNNTKIVIISKIEEEVKFCDEYSDLIYELKIQGRILFVDKPQTMTISNYEDHILTKADIEKQGVKGLDSYVIPEEIEAIGDNAFSDCQSLTKVKLPSQLKYIGNKAFANDTSLISISLPQSIEHIGDEAFSNCTFLYEINIPLRLNSFGKNVFSGCNYLQKVSIDVNCPVLKDILNDKCLLKTVEDFTVICRSSDVEIIKAIYPEYFIVRGRGVYNLKTEEDLLAEDSIEDLQRKPISSHSKEVEIIITRKDGNRDCVYLPEGTTIIEQLSFSDSYSIEEMVIPEGIVEIGNFTFSSFTQLKKITLPQTLTKIGKRAFENCIYLENIIIPDNVNEIGEEAFYRCINLTRINIPERIKGLGNKVFKGCINLEEVLIPVYCQLMIYLMNIRDPKLPLDLRRLIVANNNAEVDFFCETHASILTDYEISGINNKIGYVGTDYLEKFSIPKIKKAPNTFTREDIGSEPTTLCSMVINRPTQYIDAGTYYNYKKLEDIKLPSSLKRIGYMAFSGCESLEEIIIPDGVEEIDEYAFENCTRLNKVIIPPSVKIIHSSAFAGCISLTKIEIPEGVEEIHEYAFWNCGNLKEVYLPRTLKVFGKDDELSLVFQRTNPLDVLEIPATCPAVAQVLLKTSATNYYVRYNYLSDVDIFCRNNLDFTTREECKKGLYIQDYGSNDTPKRKAILTKDEIPEEVTDYTIPEGVFIIDNSSFANHKSLKSVTFSSTVKVAEKAAFISCSMLKEVNLNDGLLKLGTSAFSHCFALKQLVIPKSVEEIGAHCFCCCSNLEGAVIHGKITTLGIEVFESCKNLKKIELPDTITSIGEFAFQYCGKLGDIQLPSNLKVINEAAFAFCRGLKSITIPPGVEEIKENAFHGCEPMQELNLFACIKMIHEQAIPTPRDLTSVNITFSSVSELKAFVSKNRECLKKFLKYRNRKLNFISLIGEISFIDRARIGLNFSLGKIQFSLPKPVFQEEKPAIPKERKPKEVVMGPIPKRELGDIPKTYDNPIDKIIVKIYYLASYLSKETQNRVHSEVIKIVEQYKEYEEQFKPVYGKEPNPIRLYWITDPKDAKDDITSRVLKLYQSLKPTTSFIELFDKLDEYERMIRDNNIATNDDNSGTKGDIIAVLELANTYLINCEESIKRALLECINGIRTSIQKDIDTPLVFKDESNEKISANYQDELSIQVLELRKNITNAASEKQKIRVLLHKLESREISEDETDEDIINLFKIRYIINGIVDNRFRLTIITKLEQAIESVIKECNEMLNTDDYKKIYYHAIRVSIDCQLSIIINEINEYFRSAQTVLPVTNIEDGRELFKNAANQRRNRTIAMKWEEINNCIAAIEGNIPSRNSAEYKGLEKEILEFYLEEITNNDIPKPVLKQIKDAYLACLKGYLQLLETGFYTIDRELEFLKEIRDIEDGVRKYLNALADNNAFHARTFKNTGDSP